MVYIQNFFSGLKDYSLSIPGVSLTDVVDILIVAFFLYQLLLWVKQTRAWTLFKGVAVVLIVSGLAFVFHLNTVLWIVKNASTVGIIALMIVFQPELRKALEQLGNGNIFNIFTWSKRKSQRLTDEIVRAIVFAVRVMSEERTGALIVVEKDVPLGEFEQTGIPMNAMVSSQLLMNIFVDKTPLHDGAVIIRDNLIAASTCILPLTQAEIGRELGTRHRAAVGMSEVSDAVVVVVSEETGQISIAQAGRLQRGVTESDLYQQLTGDQAKEIKLGFWRGKRRNG